MGIVIDHARVTEENKPSLKKLCPFGAIVEEGERLAITAACKMCKLCTKKSEGVFSFQETVSPAIDKAQWRGVCVYADHTGGKIHRVTYELLGKAVELAAKIDHPVYALIIGAGVTAAAEELLYYGADRVFVYDDPAFRDFSVESYTAAFEDFVRSQRPSSVLVGATNLGRQLAPRIAARLRTGLTADCTVLEMKDNTDLVQIRPAFGGNIMAQIVSTNTRPQFCTVRYKVFAEPSRGEKKGELVCMPVTEGMRRTRVRTLSAVEKPRDVDISEAEVIVAIGRGAASEEMQKMAATLAELLGGCLACTRPLVEENIMDAKHQIGLSGRTVKPKFILCLGISGSVQFAAGMKSSDLIVAINQDPAAPIFDVADWTVVGDVNEIVPRLIEKLKEDK